MTSRAPAERRLAVRWDSTWLLRGGGRSANEIQKARGACRAEGPPRPSLAARKRRWRRCARSPRRCGGRRRAGTRRAGSDRGGARTPPGSRARARPPPGASASATAVMRRDSDGSTSIAGQWLRSASARDSTMCPSRMPAHLVGDRLFHVAARDQHGVKRGDRAARAVAGPFQQARQQREHAGRVALPRRRLAGGQADLALRAREAGQRVHHEQHAPPLVAKPLGDRGGDEGRLQPHQAGGVAGGAHDDRTGAARAARATPR